MIREVETRMLQTPSSQRKQEPMEPPNLIALLILFTAMLIPVQGFEIRGRKMIDFPSVINCANPGANSLNYYNYGCFCGIGGNGNQPVDAIDSSLQILHYGWYLGPQGSSPRGGVGRPAGQMPEKATVAASKEVGPGYRGSRAVTRCVNVMSQLPCASGSTLTNSTRHLWIMTRICARPSQAPACNEVAEMWLSHPAKWLSKGIFLVCRIGFLLGGFTDYLVTQCH
ncbi:uncharacterized protein [Scyliorhinus torazame]